MDSNYSIHSAKTGFAEVYTDRGYAGFVDAGRNENSLGWWAYTKGRLCIPGSPFRIHREAAAALADYVLNSRNTTPLNIKNATDQQVIEQ